MFWFMGLINWIVDKYEEKAIEDKKYAKNIEYEVYDQSK